MRFRQFVGQPLVIAGGIVILGIVPASVGEVWVQYGRGGGEVLSATVQKGKLLIGREMVIETGLFPTGGSSLGRGEWDVGSGYTGNRDWSPGELFSFPRFERGVNDGVGRANFERLSLPLWFLGVFLVGVGVGIRLVRNGGADGPEKSGDR